LPALQKGEELTLCASYTGGKETTDMVVIEAELLSGFMAYEQSLEALLNEIQDSTVKRYEIRFGLHSFLFHWKKKKSENNF
jgi:hypothetical protein